MGMTLLVTIINIFAKTASTSNQLALKTLKYIYMCVY